MADSPTALASESKTDSLDNGFDPPDIPSLKVSTKNKVEEGAASGISKKEVDDRKDVEVAKVALEEEKGLECMRDEVSKKDANEVGKKDANEVGKKDANEVENAENEKSLERDNNVDDKDQGNTNDEGEMNDVNDAKKDNEDCVDVNQIKNAQLTDEANEKKDAGENFHLVGENEENESEDRDANKDAREGNEMDRKINGRQTICSEGLEEAKEGNNNKDVGITKNDEEEKVSSETKDKEGNKAVEEVEHGKEDTALDVMEAAEKVVAELKEDIRSKSTVPVLGNAKNGEKISVNDAKVAMQKKLAEGKAYNDDNIAKSSKNAKNKQGAQEINDDEQKRDLGGNTDTKSNLKQVGAEELVKPKGKIKDTNKVAAKGGKKKIASDENNETIVKDMDEEKDDFVEDLHASEKLDVSEEGDDERVKPKRKIEVTEKVAAKGGKKKFAAIEKDETIVRDMDEEKEDAAEEVHSSEEMDVSEEEDNDDDIEKKQGNKLKKSSTAKKDRRQRTTNKSKIKEKVEAEDKVEEKDKGEAKPKKESQKKTKELSATSDTASPIGSSRERPVRERKTVERLVEVIEKGPDKAVVIEKGRGTLLKDIPNVAYKVSRKKPIDLKFLHQTLFGRRGRVIDFKNNILHFSGFAWHEAEEEKQRAKIKEKLEKCVKDNLLELCDMLDLAVAKSSIKKEEVMVKIMDFLEAPHATTDTILAEKEQLEKSKKRKRIAEGSSRRSGGTRSKKSKKRRATPKSRGKYTQDTDDEDENEDEDEDTENGVAEDDDVPMQSVSEANENESSEASEKEGETEDDDDDDDFGGKGKQDKSKSLKKQGSASVGKKRIGSNTKKVSLETQIKSPAKAPSVSKLSKAKKNDTGEMVFTRKKKKDGQSPEAGDDERENVDADDLDKRNQDVMQSPKQQSSFPNKRKRTRSNSKKASTAAKGFVSTPPSDKQVKAEKDDTGEKVFTRKKKEADSPEKTNPKSNAKDSSSVKKAAKGKTIGEEKKAVPSKTDLRNTICEILKEVDFNTATFTDILKKLAAHYKVDLTSRKAAIKQMIQEELTKLADEAEDSEEEDEEAEKEETVKEENPKLGAKKAKA